MQVDFGPFVLIDQEFGAHQVVVVIRDRALVLNSSVCSKNFDEEVLNCVSAENLGFNDDFGSQNENQGKREENLSMVRLVPLLVKEVDSSSIIKRKAARVDKLITRNDRVIRDHGVTHYEVHYEDPVKHLERVLDGLLVQVGWGVVNSKHEVLVEPVHSSKVDDCDDEQDRQPH